MILSLAKSNNFFLNPFLVEGISWISENLIYTYFIGLVIGSMFVDFAYSIQLATKLKQIKETGNERFEELKKKWKEKINEIKTKSHNLLK